MPPLIRPFAPGRRGWGEGRGEGRKEKGTEVGVWWLRLPPPLPGLWVGVVKLLVRLFPFRFTFGRRRWRRRRRAGGLSPSPPGSGDNQQPPCAWDPRRCSPGCSRPPVFTRTCVLNNGVSSKRDVGKYIPCPRSPSTNKPKYGETDEACWPLPLPGLSASLKYGRVWSESGRVCTDSSRSSKRVWGTFSDGHVRLYHKI